LFEEAKHPGAEHGSDGRGSYDEPAVVVAEEVSGTAASSPVEAVAECIAERLENGV
jgi:hypothetical protein